jgi:hypothetical protein
MNRWIRSQESGVRGQWPVAGWLLLLLLAAPLARVTARAGEPKPAAAEAADECAEALQKWYLEISQKMTGGDGRAKRKTVAALLPTCEEFEGFFGKLVEKIWAVYEQPFASLRTDLETLTASFPASNVTLKAIHLVHADEQRGYGAGLKLIPAHPAAA